MAYTQILIDTNSYLRLAQTIHPLLGQPFGEEEYALYILSELNVELNRSPRLQNNFGWINDDEWKENRKKIYQPNRKQKKSIDGTFDYMWAEVKDTFLFQRGKGPSKVDTLILATAAEIGIEAVTDDQDMIELAGMYGVPHLTSLELMKRMLDLDFIIMDIVEGIVSQWQYENDTPYKNWKKEYRSLFGKTPPKM